MPAESAIRDRHFTQLQWSLQALAVAAPDQLTLFPEEVVTPDQLASNFDYSMAIVRDSYGAELTPAQKETLGAIDRKLATMSRDGSEFDPDLWTRPALGASTHWEEVRALARSALEVFGWP
jgi:hypothetical protein